MPPFPPHGAILTLLRVTGTIAIAQTLLNVYLVITGIYTQKHGILANQKPLTCIVVVQRFAKKYYIRHVILGSMCEKCKIL
jgi:hypothetical protein